MHHAQREGRSVRGILGDKHDLIADQLDHPRLHLMRKLMGLGFETFDQVDQLTGVESLRQGGESNQVDESNCHLDNLAVVAALGAPLA